MLGISRNAPKSIPENPVWDLLVFNWFSIDSWLRRIQRQTDPIDRVTIALTIDRNHELIRSIEYKSRSHIAVEQMNHDRQMSTIHFCWRSIAIAIGIADSLALAKAVRQVVACRRHNSLSFRESVVVID